MVLVYSSAVGTGGSQDDRQAGLFRQVFERVAEAMLVVDDGGRVVEANAAACRLVGLEREALAEMTIEDLLPGAGAIGQWSGDEEVVVVARADGTQQVVGCAVAPEVLPGRHLVVLAQSRPQVRERVKEGGLIEQAGVLHEAGRLLARREQPTRVLLAALAALIPPAWQYPAQTAACIRFGEERVATAGFRETQWQQTVPFATAGGRQGAITVAYLGGGEEEQAEEGVFLEEEQATLEALGQMLRTELDRREAESRLRFQAQLLDSVGERVVAMDMEGRVTYWGKGSGAYYGLSREEALGRTMARVMQMRPEEAARIRREVRESGLWWGEYGYVTGDGLKRWTSLTVSPVFDAEGKQQGYVAVGRDSTARRQREEELATLVQVAEALRGAQRPSDLFSAVLEQMRTLFQANGVAIGLETEGEMVRIEAATAGWQRVEGLVLPINGGITGRVMRSRESFASDNMVREEALGHPEYFWDGLSAVCLPLLVGEVAAGVLWVVRESAFSDGDLRLLRAVTGMVAATLQRVSLFERVEAQALQMQRLMDTVEEGLLLLDGEREIVLANPAADRYLGVLAAEVDEAGRWQALGGRSLDTLLGGPETNGVIHEVRGGGPPARTFEVLAHPVSPAAAGAGGGGWVLVLRDVTEERRMQEKIQQQERLAAVGQLAAGIAHDFNNILAAIVLYAQVLQQSDYLREKDRRRMGAIYQQAQQATSLVRQILDFSRRSVLKRERLDMVLLVEEVIALLRRTLPENVQIAWRPPEEAYRVEGDEARLKQVIMNLAINARDAMPDGGALQVVVEDFRPEAEAESPVGPGRWLRLLVRDTGIGMNSAILPHIFEPFFTTKGPGEGAGLGLAQVYGIVHQHQGEIVVDSEPGRGTTFTVYLPLLVAEPDGDELMEPGGRGTMGGQMATILLVEDEAAVREALEATLEMLGYRVLVADDGNSALELFRRTERRIDLVLSDLVMARMGGEELYRRLQALEPGLKMMILTGYPLEDRGKALLEQGIVAWLPKPVSVDVLQARLEEVLGE